MALMRHRYVDHGEHHEYVRLQRDDQDMEDRPDQAERDGKQGAGNAGARHHPQEEKDDLARVHVAEEPQRVRQGLGDVLDQVEEEIRQPQQHVRAEGRAEELVDPASQALHRDREVDHQEPHRKRQRESRVDVRGGNDAESVRREKMRDPRNDVHRQEIHGVHQQHPQANGERRGRDKPAVAVEDVLRLVVDEFEEDLDEGLALVGHAGCGAAHHPPEKTETDDAEERRGRERVHVQRPERAFAHRVLKEAEVMADVGGRRQFMLGGHCGKLFVNPTFREPIPPW